MSWTLTVTFKDVNGDAVAGGTAFLSVWTGAGTVQNLPPQPATSGTLIASLADNFVHITIRLQHVEFADCIVVLNRVKPTDVLWLGSASQVSQNGSGVAVAAVTRRLRAASQQRVTDRQISDLKARAAAAKARQLERWKATARKGDPPYFTDLQPASGYLVKVSTESEEAIFFPTPEALNDLHLMKPDPIGDPTKSGWERFASTTANADPGRIGAFALLEYGEVSPLVAQAPRFLVACWVPETVLKTTRTPVDFLIWFTPTVTGENYPPDEYPFRKAYPYEIWAGGDPASPVQRYLVLPWLHMTRASGEKTSHYLTYLTAAAGKSTVIVVPVCPAAPKAAYEAFETQPGLMRLLKELCMQIALFRQDKPAQYGSPPDIGQIALAGLSAGVQRSQAVFSATSALSPYTDSRWQADAGQFRQKWREFWSFDAAYTGVKDKSGKVLIKGSDQFRGFLNASASWVQQSDGRHLRIYKTDFTAGANVGKQWDPRVETATVFRRMLKAAAPLQVQESKSPFALSVNDAGRRWQCISLSEEYMRDPNGSTDLPEIPIGRIEFEKLNPGVKYGIYHDAVPRMFLGHALLTSGLT